MNLLFSRGFHTNLFNFAQKAQVSNNAVTAKRFLSRQNNEANLIGIMYQPTTKTTIYDERYQSKANYWDFKPSSMALKILELLPPLNRSPKVLEIGSGERGTSFFLARNGYDVTAFDLAETGVRKTLEVAE